MTENVKGKLAQATAVVPATPEQVWRALIDPALVKEYFFGTTVTTDWQQGSTITYSGEWEGKPYQDKGIVLEVDEPRLLVTSFYSPMSGLPDVTENYQTVSYAIEPVEGGSRVDGHTGQQRQRRGGRAVVQQLADDLGRAGGGGAAGVRGCGSRGF